MAKPEHLKILKKGVKTWNKWREKNPEITPDFKGAELSGCNLDGANLREADLSNATMLLTSLVGTNLNSANLSKTQLIEADLYNAILIEADLIGASVSGTNLSKSQLFGADLSNAFLVDVNLTGAFLDGTIFYHAKLYQTVLAFTSLKTAQGLETCEHQGPSSIDYHTLMASGPLPEVFLRGCGFSDEFIHYLPAFWDQPFQFYSCFISYSHADKLFARRLHYTLQGRGIRCWLDEHQVLPGDKIHRAVDEGIRLWDKVLLCCSEASLKSWWVDNEVQKALIKEERLSKERGKDVLVIIPLNLDGYMFKPEWQDWKKDILISRSAPDFTGWKNDDEKFNEQIENVIKALRADGKARVPPPKPRL
jgi:hypothetical protein